MNFHTQFTLEKAADLKRIVPGHVPPSEDNYFDDCFRRYANVSHTLSVFTVPCPLKVLQLVLRYQDTIVGQLFGVGADVGNIFLCSHLVLAAHECRPLLLDRCHRCHPIFLLVFYLFSPQSGLLRCWHDAALFCS